MDKKLEVTYSFIKPDGYEYKEAIEEMFHEVGLDIVAKKEVHFDRQLAEAQYEEHKEKDWFPKLMEYIVSGPTSHYVLMGDDAIQQLIDLSGPTDPTEADPATIRGKFGTNKPYNAVHRTAKKEDAPEEVYLHFKKDELPELVVEILDTYQ